MNLMNRLDIIAYDIISSEQELDKCSQVSKTKKDIQAKIPKIRETIGKRRAELTGYRSSLDHIIPGEERNTISDELSAICDDIGNAVFSMNHGNTKEAEELLISISKRIQGY